MKKLAVVLAVAVTALVAVAAALGDNVSVGHSGWQWGNPQPQGNQLNAIDFAGGTGFAAGNFGTLLKTTDGGADLLKVAGDAGPCAQSADRLHRRGLPAAPLDRRRHHLQPHS